MYAVIKTGGKQYRVGEGDLLRVEKIKGEIGEVVEFEEILMIVNGERVEIGRPVLNDSKVVGEIVEQGKGKKVIVFKSKRRKGYSKKQGHRQQYTVLKIKEIKG
ncbi:MAG: 50S ribosomal protein L21 [Deltaproteobacteria bacterium]|jgi:large subunit ribosomal protein L21|nr:50S ribosomal protein L21 [Deltaproteobacteria bacterium]MCK5423175.1 50S ribosomal protein L21 [Deltaproteobacteria bacterium]